MQFCFKIKAFSNDNKKIHTAILWWSHPSSQGLWLPSETLLISWIASDYLGKPSDQGWAAYFSSPAFPLKGSGGKNVLVGQVLSVGLLAPLKGLAVWRKPGQASGFSDCPAWLVCCVRGAFGGTQWSAVKDYSRRGRWLLDPVHFEDTPEEKLSNLCRVFCRTQLTLPRYTHTHTHSLTQESLPDMVRGSRRCWHAGSWPPCRSSLWFTICILESSSALSGNK